MINLPAYKKLVIQDWQLKIQEKINPNTNLISINGDKILTQNSLSHYVEERNKRNIDRQRLVVHCLL